MALSLTPTLQETREEVLTRNGYATSGNKAANVQALVDSFVRAAQRELFVRMNWTMNQKRATLPLIQGQQQYDWPDDVEPGDIRTITVTHTNGHEYDVGMGLRTNERDASRTDGVVDEGRPVLATYVDKMIEFWPAPSAEYLIATIDYSIGSSVLVDDADRLVVDGEACIQLATMKFKRHLGIDVARDDVATFERYLTDLQSRQSTGEGFQLGGHQSFRNAVQKVNRVAAQRRNGNGQPFSTEWNPW